jgi:hypothetical protein
MTNNFSRWFIALSATCLNHHLPNHNYYRLMSRLIRPPAPGPIGPRSHNQTPRNLRKFFRQQNRKNDVMGKSTPTLTLTQSGLLTVLLQRQRYVRFQLAKRRVHGKDLHAAAWRTHTWPWRALTPRAARRVRCARGRSRQAPHFASNRAFWN